MHAYLVVLHAVVMVRSGPPNYVARDGAMLFIGGQAAAEEFAADWRLHHTRDDIAVVRKEVLQFAGVDRVVLVESIPYGVQP